MHPPVGAPCSVLTAPAVTPIEPPEKIGLCYGVVTFEVNDDSAPAGRTPTAARPVVYAVDDDESMLRSLWRLLSLAGYDVKTFSSAREFLDQVDSSTHGCVILDLRMPGMSGLDALEEMRRIGCTLPLIFLSGEGDIPSAVRAVKGGALDFLTKPVDPPQFLATIEKALARHREILAADVELQALRALFARLTQREKDVCLGIGRGLLNKQIAGELGISEKTVKIHRGRVTRKLKVRSVAELVQLLSRLGPI